MTWLKRAALVAAWILSLVVAGLAGYDSRPLEAGEMLRAELFALLERRATERHGLLLAVGWEQQ